jgi:recombination associated protein RdgC
VKLTAATIFKVKGLNYHALPVDLADDDRFENLLTHDPAPSQWNSMGFHLGSPETTGFPLEGGSEMITYLVQHNDRILPGSVRDEKVKARVADITERDGRKPGKKQYRQIRDDVENELLPQAFIRRSGTLVTFTREHLIIWSSSAKKCDEIVGLIFSLFAAADIEGVQFEDITDLTNLTYTATHGRDNFENGSSAVLVRDEEGTPICRVKNVAVDSQEVQELLTQGYRVRELALTHKDTLDFVLTDKNIFKRINLGVKDDDREGFEGLLFLTAKSLLAALRDLTEETF